MLRTAGFVLALSLAVNAATVNADADVQASGWSVAVRGGAFFPDFPEWKTFYGRDQVPQFGATVGRRFARIFALELDADYMGERGEGYLPLNDRKGGKVLHEQATLSLGAAIYGQFSPRQVLVPYVGAGYSHLFYQQSVQGGQQSRGGADGAYARAGIAWLVDRLDPSGASSLRRRWGIQHTYLYLDYRYLEIEKNDIDLGGATVSLGVRLDY